MKKVCLVTNELPTIGSSGGIGTAFHELALALAYEGFDVTIWYAEPHLDETTLVECATFYDRYSIKFEAVNFGKYVWDFNPIPNRSYAICQALLQLEEPFDIIHFHEYLGLGFYPIQIRRLGNQLKNTTIVVQAHGSTRWTMAANRSLLQTPDHLLVDFMERAVLEKADFVISPSEYLLDWMKNNGFVLPEKSTKVIQNLSRPIQLRKHPDTHVDNVTEIVMFGRHEYRKGLLTFCSAIEQISSLIAKRDVLVTFLGRPDSVNGTPSEVVLTERGRNWRFRVQLLTSFNRDQALGYLSSRPTCIVVVPSSEENSPYTVLESLTLGKPTITSAAGGAKELISPELHPQFLYDGSAGDLAKILEKALNDGIPTGKPAQNHEVTKDRWIDFHREISTEQTRTGIHKGKLPKVVLGITHFERPEKLTQAIFTAIQQTYGNLEVVVVDDGSQSLETRKSLEQIEQLLSRCGGRLLQRDNGYLGAARNTIARETESDYLIFLDDDDLAFPTMVEELVTAALRYPQSIIAPLNLYMEEARRSEGFAKLSKFPQKMVSCFTGGPLSFVPFGNVISAATALIPRSIYDKVGGYSEVRGVGYEDFEFFVRALQCGATIEVLPLPLYLYEVDRPSMISETPVLTNLRRVIDAIDFTMCPDEWRNLVSCIAAPKALEGALNRAIWMENKSAHADLLRTIRTEPMNSPKRHQTLAELADAIGSPSMAYAWQNANNAKTAVQRSAASNQRSVVSMLDEANRTERRRSINITKSLILAQIGEASEAIEHILDELEFAYPLSEISLSTLSQTVERAGSQLSKEDAEKMMDALLKASVDEKVQEETLLKLVFVLATAAGDTKRRETVIKRFLAIEEQAYLTAYSDIREAVEHGRLRAGLEHYIKWGASEGRIGFEFITSIHPLADKKHDYFVSLIKAERNEAAKEGSPAV